MWQLLFRIRCYWKSSARFSLLFTFLLWYHGQRFRCIIISFHLFHADGYFEIKNRVSFEYLNVCILMVSAFYIGLGCTLFLFLFPNFLVILGPVMDITARVYVKNKQNPYRYSMEFWSIMRCEKHLLKYPGTQLLNFSYGLSSLYKFYLHPMTILRFHGVGYGVT